MELTVSGFQRWVGCDYNNNVVEIIKQPDLYLELKYLDISVLREYKSNFVNALGIDFITKYDLEEIFFEAEFPASLDKPVYRKSSK